MKIAELVKEIEEFALSTSKKEAMSIHPKFSKHLRSKSELKLESEDGRAIVKMSVGIYYDSRPWKFYIFGTKPHTICARLWRQCGKPDPLWKHASRVLVFRTKSGSLVFARKVKHPGFEGKKNQFIKAREKAYEEVMKWIEKKFEKLL